MLKPQRATPNTPVKAEHINSHARAIEEIQSRIDTFVPNTKPSIVASGRLPFTIRVTPTSLIGAPGTIEGSSIAEKVETSPANGTWYFLAKVTINNSTGVITAAVTQWLTSNPSNTATEFYSVLATVDVVSGIPDSSTITQFNYGPIFVVFYGAVSNVWKIFVL